MMTPGDFASLQEGREGLSTEDYIAWKLPYVVSPSLSPPSLFLLFFGRYFTFLFFAVTLLYFTFWDSCRRYGVCVCVQRRGRPDGRLSLSTESARAEESERWDVACWWRFGWGGDWVVRMERLRCCCGWMARLDGDGEREDCRGVW